ncbi:MAG: hypothetical protein Q8902_01960 [Bacteroidota bacterium]|nr:hypothetical protein [Bacteroidota bacterium]
MTMPLDESRTTEAAPMRVPPYITRRSSIIIGCAGFAIAACWWPFRMRFPFDDTYITFRYAANIAHGFGIVWNPGGPHTEGYTNFLYVLLLAPFSALGLDLVVVAQAINVLAVITSAIAVGRLILKDSPGRSSSESPKPKLSSSILGAAFFLLDPFTWFNAHSGMETSLFTMWVVLVVATAGRPLLPFVFATLASLTRPEGALFGVILLAAKILQDRSASKVSGTGGARESRGGQANLRNAFYVFGLPLALYAVWKYSYFGNLLPNSFYVKVAQPQGPDVGKLPGLGTLFRAYAGMWIIVVLAALAWLRVCIRDRRVPSVMLIPTAWIVLLSIFYLFSHLIQPEYQRFTNSIEAMLIVLAGVAFQRYRNRASAAIFLGLLACHIAWSIYFRGGLSYFLRTNEYLSCYTRVASVLRTIPDHEKISLAWGDAGRIPYFAGLQHIDPIGLNTTAIAHAHSAEEVIRFIMQSRPDLIVIPLNLPHLGADTATDNPCRLIIRMGDGPIGRSYPALEAAAVANAYQPIVMIPQTVYDLDVFADTRSPHYHDIVQTLVPRIGHDSDFLPVPDCLR